MVYVVVVVFFFFTKVSVNANWSLSHRQESGRMPAFRGSSDM